MNCRKMFEFFKYKRDQNAYLRAAHFIDGELGYTFKSLERRRGSRFIRNAHLLHVGGTGWTTRSSTTAGDDKQYFADFEGAWQTLMKSLKPQHREIFRDEIDFRLQDREFEFCGTLGKEFIPL